MQVEIEAAPAYAFGLIRAVAQGRRASISR